MVTTAGIYTIPLADYVLDPAPEPSLSASVAHVLLKDSPLHAWHTHPRLNPAYEQKEASQFDVGTVAHGILLEGKRDGIMIVEADDWRTKAAREQRDEAREAGKIPVLIGQMAVIEAMVKVAKEAIAGSELPDAFGTSGRPEYTLIWQGPGIWLRSRPDWASNNWRVVIDYKTTAAKAEPSTWARGPMLGNGFDLQAALALRGVKALANPPDCTFLFIVQEVEPPYAVSFVGLSPDFLQFAQVKLNYAMTLWRQCLETCNWPGYPSRVCWAELPGWAMTQWTERTYQGEGART